MQDPGYQSTVKRNFGVKIASKGLLWWKEEQELIHTQMSATPYFQDTIEQVALHLDVIIYKSDSHYFVGFL